MTPATHIVLELIMRYHSIMDILTSTALAAAVAFAASRLRVTQREAHNSRNNS
jgi:hypothetical protein